MTKKRQPRGRIQGEEPEAPSTDPTDERAASGVDPEVRMRAFMQGEIQLSDLFEFSHDELYEICGFGQTLFENGKLEEAAKVFDALTALAPYESNFHVAYGVVLQHQKQKEEALREFDRAVALNEFDVPARTLRAELLLEFGKLDHAAVDLERVILLDPQGQTPHGQRAMGMALAVHSMMNEAVHDRRVAGESEAAPPDENPEEPPAFMRREPVPRAPAPQLDLPATEQETPAFVRKKPAVPPSEASAAPAPMVASGPSEAERSTSVSEVKADPAGKTKIPQTSSSLNRSPRARPRRGPRAAPRKK